MRQALGFCWQRWSPAALLAVLALAGAQALAQSPPPAQPRAPIQTPVQAPVQAPVQRLRGSVASFDGQVLVLNERGGEVLRLAMAPNASISEVLPIALSAIQPNSFVGTAALPQADGTLRALEVLVFPEAARGTGEGHYPWDLQPGSTMTNATVADVVGSAQGRTLTLRYKDGTQTVAVPEGTPVVTFQPGDRSLLVPGAKVLVTAQLRDGQPTALRVLAGRNGFAPPM